MRPITLLGILSALATLGGVWSWSSFKATETTRPNVPTDGPQPMLPELAGGDNANGTLQRQVQRFQEQNQLLKDENTRLRKDLSQALTADAAEGKESAPATSAALTAPTEAPASSALPSGETADLQRLAQRLEDQNQKFQKDNQDLRERLNRILEAKEPPPTPEFLAERVGKMRGLAFKEMPKFHPVSMDDLQKRIYDNSKAQISDAASEARSKAYVAMNFVVDPFSFRDAMVNSMVNQATAVYDPKTNEAFYQNDADLRRNDGRDRVAAAAHWALLQQNFPVTYPLPLATDQDDAACALRAVALGDNTFYRIRWSLQDNLVNLTENPPPGFPRQDYTPLYFSEQYKFCADQGKSFVDALLQQAGPNPLGSLYERLPKSTAELLHPELYSATPPFQPKEIPASVGEIEGAKPYFTNVAGEFSTDISFRYYMSPDLAVRIADGWAGDRYWVYEGDAQYGDHVLWKTHWRTPEDGQEFFDGMRRVLMQRFTIPYQKEYDQPGAFVVEDPHRVIRVRISADKLQVSVVNATDAKIATQLDAK